MNRLRCLLGLVLVGLLVTTASADSIWARRSPRWANLWQDVRARNIGDILTILIQETSNINQREQRQLNKATTISDNFQYAGDSNSGTTTRTGAANFQMSNASNRNFQGNAQLTSDRTYTDRVAATVVDVLPNGVLVVEGTRVRCVSGERRIIRITGLVRPADLDPNNIVTSQAVANFKIEYIGRGVDSNFVNQGWLGRVFNILWPF